MKTLKRESRGGEIEEIEKEIEDGKAVYEAEVEFGDMEYEIEIAEDGTLLSKVLEEDDDEDYKQTADEEEQDDGFAFEEDYVSDESPTYCPFCGERIEILDESYIDDEDFDENDEWDK